MSEEKLKCMGLICKKALCSNENHYVTSFLLYSKCLIEVIQSFIKGTGMSESTESLEVSVGDMSLVAKLL